MNPIEVMVEKHVQNIIGKLGTSARTYGDILAVGIGPTV